MHCARCHYDLRGNTSSRCPECGQPFDPGDPSTYDHGSRRWLGPRLAVVHAIAAGWPIVIFISVHLAYLAAAAILGRWPAPSVDDPKGIPYPGIPLGMVYIVMMLWPLAWLAQLVAPAAALRNRRWTGAAALLLTSIAGLVVGLALIRWDPFRAVEWFMD